MPAKNEYRVIRLYRQAIGWSWWLQWGHWGESVGIRAMCTGNIKRVFFVDSEWPYRTETAAKKELRERTGCTCLIDGECDCQAFPTHVSNECPTHNDHPHPAATCAVHGERPYVSAAKEGE